MRDIERQEDKQVTPAAAGQHPAVLFIWDRFGPYHVDRCEAVGFQLSSRFEVTGVEIASFDDIYRWKKSAGGHHFSKITLFPNVRRLSVNPLRCWFRLTATCLRLRARYVFVCNYEDPVIFFAALVLRMSGAKLVVMQDSKFDDKPRRLGWEFLKQLFYAPYHAALVASTRSAEYLAFLGFRRDRIFIGYDTVSVERIRNLSRTPPAPGGVPHAERHFTVIARFVPKKNLRLALDAYAEFVARNPGTTRELHLCGAGELEEELKEHAARLGLSGVKFRGFLQEAAIASVLGSTLTLILPSVEEQFGLVINEAVAMGVPVLLSDNCGARDMLVRTAVNGYVFEPDNPDGLAHFMSVLANDVAEWERLCRGNSRFVRVSDTGYFAQAVERVISAFSGRRRPESEEDLA
jgi:L-malate glycosyltransferase